MKKLSLLVMPLMAISFLVNCGGGAKPGKTYNVTVSESDHLNFTTLDGSSLNNTKAYENEDFKFKMKVDNPNLYIVPSTIDIRVNEMDPLLEGYTINNISETEAEVTILASKIIGDIVISGNAISNGYYQYEVPYAFGLNEIVTDVHKKDGEDLIITFTPKEKENNNDTYLYPEAENIYIEFDDCPVGEKKQWVSPAETFETIGEYCSYDNSNGQLTIKSNHIRSNIVVVTKASDYPLLEKLSWQDIEKVSFSGVADYIFYLGEEKTVNVNNLDHKVRIIGFNHDDLVSGGKAGITFEFVNLITDSNGAVTTKWNTKEPHNNYNFPGSTLNDFLNNNSDCIFNKLPDGLKEAIKEVNKKVGLGESYSTVTPYQTKLFLLAHDEMTTHTEHVADDEGMMYEYYIYNTNLNKRAVNGEIEHYWVRSPYTNYNRDDYAWKIFDSSGTGSFISDNIDYYPQAVAPAFCI